ncbi:hypothetical protein B0J12DRAFT_760203 [Macrophomina phaseolina]|uniref:Uncharacterized protein n=1 Tax=Macrophomina phaseolina TaxID=35725 RepID=A0ABQ8G3R2_9PEZI|nr:hypothetical protein B0J12DRAFT_760203 [Macrophomina phaseolina]
MSRHSTPSARHVHFQDELEQQDTQPPASDSQVSSSAEELPRSPTVGQSGALDPRAMAILLNRLERLVPVLNPIAERASRRVIDRLKAILSPLLDTLFPDIEREELEWTRRENERIRSRINAKNIEIDDLVDEVAELRAANEQLAAHVKQQQQQQHQQQSAPPQQPVHRRILRPSSRRQQPASSQAAGTRASFASLGNAVEGGPPKQTSSPPLSAVQSREEALAYLHQHHPDPSAAQQPEHPRCVAARDHLCARIQLALASGSVPLRSVREQDALHPWKARLVQYLVDQINTEARAANAIKWEAGGRGRGYCLMGSVAGRRRPRWDDGPDMACAECARANKPCIVRDEATGQLFCLRHKADEPDEAWFMNLGLMQPRADAHRRKRDEEEARETQRASERPQQETGLEARQQTAEEGREQTRQEVGPAAEGLRRSTRQRKKARR